MHFQAVECATKASKMGLRLGPMGTERDPYTEEFSAAARPVINGMHGKALPRVFCG
jgi:hypothetical protein